MYIYTWAQLYSRSPLRKKTFRLDYGFSLLVYIRLTRCLHLTLFFVFYAWIRSRIEEGACLSDDNIVFPVPRAFFPDDGKKSFRTARTKRDDRQHRRRQVRYNNWEYVRTVRFESITQVIWTFDSSKIDRWAADERVPRKLIRRLYYSLACALP